MTALTIIKPLPRPWMVAGKAVTEIELRPATLEDLIEAEKEAHPGMAPTAFNAALACRQLLRAGEFTGPFTVGLLKSMPPASWYAVRTAMDEAEELGEGGQLGQAQPS